MILTIEDDIGWLAWKGWQMTVWGEGDSEEEAIEDLKEKLQ